MPAWFEAHFLADPIAKRTFRPKGSWSPQTTSPALWLKRPSGLAGTRGRNWCLGALAREAPSGHGRSYRNGALSKNYLLTGQTRGHTGASPGPGSTEPKDAVLAMIPPFDLSVPTGSLEQITIFLGHRADNTYVNVELGRQAAHVLTQAG
ncbi:hypothetical protein RB597_001726 [Gaeumannomyces tritici]